MWLEARGLVRAWRAAEASGENNGRRPRRVGAHRACGRWYQIVAVNPSAADAGGKRSCPLCSREFFQQGIAFAEPGAFAALHVARQSALFGQEFLRPLAGFVGAVRGFQEAGVVVESFGRSGD